MKQEEITEKKYAKPGAVRYGWRRTGYVGNKPHKIKIKEIKDNVFESGQQKNAAQFTKSLQNVADYVQMK